MLRELTIENYRCFQKLHVKDLAQVNLIVGKNNVGKTSFLEAVYLYVSQGNSRCFLELLSARELTYEPALQGNNIKVVNQYQLGDLFNMGNQARNRQTFTITSFSDMELRADFMYSSLIVQFAHSNSMGEIEDLVSMDPRRFPHYPSVSFYLPTKDNLVMSSLEFQHSKVEGPVQNSEYPYRFIESRGLGFEELRQLWEKITLTPEEDDVEEALRLLETRVERIGFTTNRQPSIGSIKVRLKGEATPIALSSLGDGMRRILGLAMSLAVSKSGYLVIDEIDMGLHYEAQFSMWRLVLETARRLNVQVFATTHSWDSISAFQAALEEMEDPSIGKLIRLDARGDQLRAVEYKAEELEIAVSHGIEVR
jgi:AAA domain, putative AbiEii toxin, Type IV TA system/AAA ATPase domain